uniref:Uncharacterized protein n=1 Tax=Anguilla anguilla TaxID=7936 RepID=A0A0E9UH05_ANGAN
MLVCEKILAQPISLVSCFEHLIDTVDRLTD